MFKLFLISMLVPLAAAAQQNPKTTVVLVHGAFADGSSWDRVIPSRPNAVATVILAAAAAVK